MLLFDEFALSHSGHSLVSEYCLVLNILSNENFDLRLSISFNLNFGYSFVIDIPKYTVKIITNKIAKLNCT